MPAAQLTAPSENTRIAPKHIQLLPLYNTGGVTTDMSIRLPPESRDAGRSGLLQRRTLSARESRIAPTLLTPDSSSPWTLRSGQREN